MTERDLSVFFIPPRILWVDAIKNWQLPLWNPYYYSGIPLLAALQPAVFYPLNILLLILPFDLAFNWIIILHFFLSGVFTFLLLRELGASIVGAFIGALIFMLGGYMISVHNLLSTLLSVTWVPLAIFLYLRIIKRNSLAYVVFLGIILAIMFTGGGIEVVYGTLGLLLFLALLPETLLKLCPENPSQLPPNPTVAPRSQAPAWERNYREALLPVQARACQPNVFPSRSLGTRKKPNRIRLYFLSIFSPLPRWEGIKGRVEMAHVDSPASVKKRIIFLFLSITIFLLLSAVQLLPFLELSHYSIRASGLSYTEATTWSMDLKDLIQFFIPDPYGYGTSEAKYWSNQSWLKTIYIGTIPFILSAFFFVEKGRKTLPFLLLLLFSFVLAFGKNTAIYEYLYYYLPSFNKIRYPVKFLFLVFIFLSISAGLGWDSLKQSLEQGRKGVKWIIIGLLCLATLSAIVFGYLSYFDKEVKEFLIAKRIKYPEYNEVYINVFNAKRLLVIFMMSVLILYGGLRSVKARKALPYFLVSILTIDLFFAHFGYYFARKTEEYHKSSESMDFILKDKGELFRIFITPRTKKGEVVVSATEKSIQNETASLPDIGKEIIQGYNLGKEIIQGYNLERRIFDIDGVEVMRFADYEKIFLFLTAVPRIDSTNLLALLNVKYVLSIPKIKSNEFKLVKVIRPEHGKAQKKFEKEGFLKIYQNLNYLPRAFLVEKYMLITKEEDYKNIMKNKGFKPGEEVLLYEEPGEGKRAEVRSQKSEVDDSELMIQNSKSEKKSASRKREDEVAIVDYRNNSIKLNVNTDRPKILVLSETYYPGWKAYVDGQEKKILKANFAFRAIPLSAGQHEVEFIYDPWTFKIGLYITLATVISLSSFGIFAFFFLVPKLQLGNAGD